ncbi:MAG: class I SAM-dependent methyltransferase [Candidatus Cloacimonetes bacterium]|nr:class I SAM-dependent methyltransferase [Candidatus Cloacimonadota bacterium]
MDIKESYSIFARFYDDYMEHVDYDNWVNFILSQYNQRHADGMGIILELACGTGNIANRLVKRRFTVEASDISEEMIAIAGSKPFAANFHQADMLTPLPHNRYDLILLLFDSLNYLQTPFQVKKLFANVKSSLCTNGMFIFDISTEKNCLDNFDGFLNIEDNEDSFLVHQSFYLPDDKIQETQLTLFTKEGDYYRRDDEQHHQKIYPIPELIKMIRKSKLEIFGIYRLSVNQEIPIPEEEYEIAGQCYNRVFFVLGAASA